jgi:hypothetical protein
VLAGAGTVVVTLVLAAWLGAFDNNSGSSATSVSCRVAASGAGSYVLDGEQAMQATTIAAVGKQLGMPNHAVTVALATALQESGLHNLDHGDRDSLGLFQQRPSQGWGTPEQVRTPSYAARAFFTHLSAIVGWQRLSVTDVAQRVQHSAAPTAYAKWESEARVLARAMTGEVPAGVACSGATGSGDGAGLSSAVADELGSIDLAAEQPTGPGWAAAAWLVAHAARFDISSVSFSGQTWSAASGAWAPSTPVDARLGVVVGSGRR